jgi:hypothetical protein
MNRYLSKHILYCVAGRIWEDMLWTQFWKLRFHGFLLPNVTTLTGTTKNCLSKNKHHTKDAHEISRCSVSTLHLSKRFDALLTRLCRLF